MKNHIGTKYTFLGTKSTEKVLKSDEKFCTQIFFQNFTEVQAQSVLTIGTLKVLKNHAWNEITILREQKCRKQPKISEKMKKKNR